MKAPIIILMGVCGSGKSTLGELLARETGGVFYDGDDFHPPENVAKMSVGQPLNDDDRASWLRALAQLIEKSETLTLIACSALKESYREVLAQASERVEFVFLSGSPELLAERMAHREDHYMPAALLQSQLETLEPPEEALTLDISEPPEHLANQVKEHFFL